MMWRTGLERNQSSKIEPSYPVCSGTWDCVSIFIFAWRIRSNEMSWATKGLVYFLKSMAAFAIWVHNLLIISAQTFSNRYFLNLFLDNAEHWQKSLQICFGRCRLFFKRNAGSGSSSWTTALDQNLIQNRNELIKLSWFNYKVFGAKLFTSFNFQSIWGGTIEDYGNIFQPLILFDFDQTFFAAHSRHVNIHDDIIR